MKEVRDLQDMQGKVCMVTGATSGHGRAVARALARRGAELVLVGRNPEKCRAVQAEIGGENGGKAPDVLLCDLSSQSEIRRAAAEFLGSGRPLHLLVNNAGLVNQHREESVDGIEMVFSVNYLAYYQLTLLLLDRLKQSAPARIVNVSSDTHRIVSLDLEDLELRRNYAFMRAYGRSKLAIVYFTLELARRREGSGVTVNAVDPGPVDSGMGLNNPGLAAEILKRVMKLFFAAPAKAARTALMLATSEEVAGVSGRYFKFGTEREPRISRQDPELGAKLWAKSAQMTGIDL